VILPRVRLATTWPAWLAAVANGSCAVELGGRQVLRQSIFQNVSGVAPPTAPAVVGVAVLAAVGCAAWAWWRGTLSVTRLVVLALLASFVAGLALQQQLGARLQSDGFFYFAFLRSIVIDHDFSLANDYAAIGIGSSLILTPTATGYAQTAWSVGPAIAWLPFYAIGSLGARYLAGQGLDVAVNGASFPYRQAVCIAGLFYGLLGFWFCYRLASRYFAERIAALATVALAGGSFMAWYLVREPTMSHATSMCVVAAFLYLWSVTGGQRTTWQWAALGLLGGVMLAVRWQNVIFVAFPAWEIAVAFLRARDGAERGVHARSGAIFAACGLVAFSPQLAAWQAIYGSPIAVSPLSPQMFWWKPDIVRLLWSSRNGLFSTSPVVYLAAVGLVAGACRKRGVWWIAVAVFCIAVYVNASVADWWGGSAYGGRRFDGTIPLLVLGLAAAIEGLQAWLARRPLTAVGALLALLVLWNVTAMAAAVEGTFGGSMPQPFADLAADQAKRLHRWFGHPLSYPASLGYALREGVAPFRYDALAFPMLEDPTRPYGRIDLGTRDEAYVTEGWYGPEALPDGTTLRWASASAELLIPLDHAASLLVQLRVRPFAYEGAAPVLAVRINGRSFGPFPLVAGWQRVDFPTEADAWTAGVNRVAFVWPSAAIPAKVGAGQDGRELGGMVDYVRVEVRR